MATWEDGPEYAPRERPQYFADAPLPPLEQAPPSTGHKEVRPTVRPRFDEPSAPLAPLEALVPQPADERDPTQPFDVVTSTMTTESAWASSWMSSRPAADGPASGASASPVQPPAAPPAGAPWPVLEPAPGPAGFPSPSVEGPQRAPTSPFPHVPQQDPYPYPAPGTPGWFVPPPASFDEQQQAGPVDAKRVVEAATPGLCICLAVGGLIYVLAPIMLMVAVALSNRVQVAQPAVRTSFRIAAGLVGFFAVVGLYRSVFYGDPWWSFVGLWSLLICWIMLGVLLLMVWQALTRPAPPTRDPWG